MPNSVKWIRHDTREGSMWSPLAGAESKVTQIGPKPSLSQMEEFGPVEVTELQILPPVAPTRVVALAKNRRSADNDPLVFLKTPTSIIGNGDAIQLPTKWQNTWSEVELGFVIDRTARNVSLDEAANYIRGYTVANDVTMVNPTGRDLHLARGKARDTFCPVGSCLVTELDTSDLTMRIYVNGEITLETSTSKRLLDETQALVEISSWMTLEPGDLVLTGAPASPRDSVISPGDVTTVEVEDIGKLTNPVEETKR